MIFTPVHAQEEHAETVVDQASATPILDIEEETYSPEAGELQAVTSHAAVEEQPSGIAAGAQALGIDGKILIAQLINFVILLLILRHFVYKPLLSLLEKRRQTIEDSQSKAEEIQKQYAEFQVEHEKRIEKAKADANDIVEKAKTASETMRQETLATAQVEAENLITRAKEEIEREKERLMQELKGEIGSLVVAATSKIIGTEINSKKQSELIEEAIKESGK